MKQLLCTLIYHVVIFFDELTCPHLWARRGDTGKECVECGKRTQFGRRVGNVND